MAQVATALPPHYPRSRHPQSRVGLHLDRLLARGHVERGPAATRVVLRVGDEELGAAAGAAVGAGLERVVVLTCESSLRALLAQHVVLLGSQLGAPLLLCFLDLWHHSTVCRKAPALRRARGQEVETVGLIQ